MIDNDDIQAGLVAYLKAQTTTIVALLDSSGEIKEDQWQGTTFLYPAVRVDLGPQLPKANCDAADVTGFSVRLVLLFNSVSFIPATIVRSK